MEALVLGGSFARGVWMEVMTTCPMSDVGTGGGSQSRAGDRVMRDTDYKHSPIL